MPTPSALQSPQSPNRSPVLWGLAVVILVLAIAAITLQKPGGYYPEVIVEAGETVQIGMLQQSFSNRPQCDISARAVVQTMQNFCLDCEVIQARCIETLTPRQRLLLSGEPVDIPVMRVPRGILTFESDDPEIAVATCRDSARQSGGTAKCILPAPAGVVLALAATSHTQLEFTPSPEILTLLPMLAALVSALVCGLIIASQRWHGRYSHDAVESGPQKFHSTPVPRIGGIAIAGAIITVIVWLDAGDFLNNHSAQGFELLALAALPAFAGGLAEDLTKKVGVLARLLLTMAAGILASVVIDATLTRLDVPGLDNLLQHWPLFAIAFTAFAIGGVANAVNLIDGYNGLAATYAILALAAFTWVSIQVGDQVVLLASLTMLGAMVGFLVWNWPLGKIFLGDGGAYLLGFWLAELGVLLVVRNPQVSPWFPLTVMFYPIWETLFSMYRRKVLRRHQIGHPDALHLHQLVYHWFIRRTGTPKNAAEQLRRNNAVTMHLVPPIALLMLPALWLWDDTVKLLACSAAFAVTYVLVYGRIMHGRMAKPGIAA